MYKSEDRTKKFFTIVHRTESNRVVEDPSLSKRSPEYLIYFYISLNFNIKTFFSCQKLKVQPFCKIAGSGVTSCQWLSVWPKWLPIVFLTSGRHKNCLKTKRFGFFNIIGLSKSNKSPYLYHCLIRDSLDISAKVWLLKWRFSFFKFLLNALISYDEC